MFQWRVTAVASSREDLITALEHGHIIRAGPKSGILGVFTGQGAQHYAMARGLFECGEFKQSIQAADKYLTDVLKAGWSVKTELTRSEADSKIHAPQMAQPLCTIVQIALIELLGSWGIAFNTV